MPIKTNPIQSQYKPNSQKAQMNVNSLITKDYRKKDDFAVPKNKPKTNPIKPNFKRGTCAAQTFLTETLVRRSFSEGGCAFGSKI